MPIRRRVHSGTELTNTETDMLTFSGNLTEGGAIIASISISNLSSSRRLATIHFRAVGNAATEGNCIYQDYVPPNRTISVPGGPWWDNSSAIVSALGDTASSKVGVRVSAFEEYIA